MCEVLNQTKSTYCNCCEVTESEFKWNNEDLCRYCVAVAAHLIQIDRHKIIDIPCGCSACTVLSMCMCGTCVGYRKKVAIFVHDRKPLNLIAVSKILTIPVK